MDKIERIFSSVKVGESYKNRSWSLSREDILKLIPPLSYETECDIIVDGVYAKARFNIEPRIFFNRDQEDLISHLQVLSGIDKKRRIQFEMLLNHDDDVIIKSESKKISSEKNKLEYDLWNKDVEISKLKEYVSFLKKENNSMQEKFLALEQENKNLNEKLNDLLNIE